MSTYVRKPKVIEAIQWKGDLEKVKKFVTKDVTYLSVRDNSELFMMTSNGGCWSARLGDYICRYADNKHFIFERGSFEREYDRA